MSSFLAFCRAAAQKQNIIYSGAKHSPPTSVLGGPSGWNGQFAKIYDFAMFFGNLYEICLRHEENLKYALFLYLRTLFSWGKQRNLDNARGGILTAPSWHQKCKYFSNFRKWRISTTRNRIQPPNEQFFHIWPRSCAKTTYCLQWCEALSSNFDFRGPFGLKIDISLIIWFFSF